LRRKTHEVKVTILFERCFYTKSLLMAEARLMRDAEAWGVFHWRSFQRPDCFQVLDNKA
jgi:hypothetical protein